MNQNPTITESEEAYRNAISVLLANAFSFCLALLEGMLVLELGTHSDECRWNLKSGWISGDVVGTCGLEGNVCVSVVDNIRRQVGWSVSEGADEVQVPGAGGGRQNSRGRKRAMIGGREQRQSHPQATQIAPRRSHQALTSRSLSSHLSFESRDTAQPFPYDGHEARP